MQKGLVRKGLTFGIIVLFVGTGVTSSIGSNIVRLSRLSNENSIDNKEYISSSDFIGDIHSLNFPPDIEWQKTYSDYTKGNYVILTLDGRHIIADHTFSGDFLFKTNNQDDIITISITDSQINIKQGWPFDTELTIFSSPTIADLDGDNYQEIIIVTGLDYHGYDPDYSRAMRKIFVLDTNGNIKEGWPKNISSHNNKPPSVGDLDNDSDLEIVIFSRLVQDEYDNGYIYAWHHNGSNVSGWPIPFSSWENGVPPTIADLDNNHLPEIIISELPFKKAIKLYNNSGGLLPNWPQPHVAYYYGAVGNFDNDDDNEFIVAAGQIGDGINSSVTVWNKDASLVNGWPKLIPEILPDGQPIIGDLDDDGKNEIIFPTSKDNIYILDSSGNNFPNWPIGLNDMVLPSLVLGDLNNDGDPNIIGIENFGENNTARVHVWNVEGNELSGFPVDVFLPPEYEYRWLSSMGAPIIIDIDEDGYQEIICAFQQWGLNVPSYLYAIDHDGNIKNDEIWPIFQGIGLWQQHSSLAAGDIDNDGMIELISAYSKHNLDYPNISYGGGEVVVYEFNTQLNPLLMDWPMFQHDPQHLGRYIDNGNNAPSAPSISGPSSGKIGVEYEYNFSLSDPDDDSMYLRVDWESGTPGKWHGPFASGTKVKLNHTWHKKGTYTIKAQAKDTGGLESEWGTLKVTMPRSHISIFSRVIQFLQHLIQRFPMLESLFPVFSRMLNMD